MNAQFQRSMNFNGADNFAGPIATREYTGRGQVRGGQARGGQARGGQMQNTEFDHGFVTSVNKKIMHENVFRLLIRERNVKVVLGPKGENMKKLKDMCKGDCKVTIYTQSANGEQFPEGSVDRVICVETSLDDIEKVLMEMIPHFQTYPPAKMMGKFNEIRLLVPDFTCSSIIGPKGENVKNIQRDFRSFVQVHKNPAPSSTEHVVSLTNREVGALAMSAAQIYRSIQKIKGISHVTLYNPLVWYPGEFGDTGSFIEAPTLIKAKTHDGFNNGHCGGDYSMRPRPVQQNTPLLSDQPFSMDAGEGFDPTYLKRGNRGGGVSRAKGNPGASRKQDRIVTGKLQTSAEVPPPPSPPPQPAVDEWFQGPEHNMRGDDADVSMVSVEEEPAPIPELVPSVTGSDSQAGSESQLYITAAEDDDETECPSCVHDEESPIPRRPRVKEPGCKPSLPLRGFGRRSFH